MVGIRYEESFFFLIIITGISFLASQNAYAVTVYPGTIISSNITNYTADASPNFNVTAINITGNHIFLGTKYYDMSKPATVVKTNITGFNEDKNFTGLITSPSSLGTNSKMQVYGLLEKVREGGFFYPYGSIWRYIGGIYTDIDLISHDIFVSFDPGSISVNSLTITGALQYLTTVFSNPIITISSPASVQVTEMALFNTTNLLDNYTFPVPITVLANTPTTLPFQFNDTNSGTQQYTVVAVVFDGTNYTLATSNTVNIFYGNFTLGHMNLNLTNPDIIPIRFERTNVNASHTELSVKYKNTYNMFCNFYYQFAMTNNTYGPLAGTPISTKEDQYNFFFVNMTNEIVNVNCIDSITKTNGTYVLTQTSLPIVELIKNFRNGTYGTHGQFGALDLITLLVIIIAMIGLNRVNEAAGVIFAIMVLGSFAFFGIIQWPTIFLGALAIVLLVAITSTRKIIGG